MSEDLTHIDENARRCRRDGCNNIFVPRRSWQIYCSKKCNRLAYFARTVLDEEAPTRKTTRGAWANEEQQEKLSTRDKLLRAKYIADQAELILNQKTGATKPTQEGTLDWFMNRDKGDKE